MKIVQLNFKPKQRLKMVGSRFNETEYKVLKKLAVQKQTSVSEVIHVIIIAAINELGLLKEIT